MTLVDSTGLEGVDWIAILGLTLLSIYVWSLSHDLVVEVASAVLVMALGAALLLLAGSWIFTGTLGAITITLGVYMLIRSGIDKFQEGDAA